MPARVSVAVYSARTRMKCGRPSAETRAHLSLLGTGSPLNNCCLGDSAQQMALVFPNNVVPLTNDGGETRFHLINRLVGMPPSLGAHTEAPRAVPLSNRFARETLVSQEAILACFESGGQTRNHGSVPEWLLRSWQEQSKLHCHVGNFLCCNWREG